MTVLRDPSLYPFSQLPPSMQQPGLYPFSQLPPSMQQPGLYPWHQLPASLRQPQPQPQPQPNINVPVGQVAQTPQPGAGNLWDALRALFSGQPSAQGQGMTGMLQPRGQAGASTDALGNPFNRFG
jgi:hypothetical protein